MPCHPDQRDDPQSNTISLSICNRYLLQVPFFSSPPLLGDMG